MHMADEYAPASFLLSYDSLTGTRQNFHVTSDQKLVLETTCNIDAIAERAQAERNESSRTQKSGDMVKVASLPMMVYLDLKQRGILDDRPAMRKWLSSEEAQPYRTHWMKS
jgi:hypothetical protein